VKRFEKIIEKAMNDIVSDVYLVGGHPLVTRKQGVVSFHHDTRYTHQEMDNLVRQLLTPRQQDSLRIRKSVDFAVSVKHARLRVNVFNTTRGLSLAIRLLPGHIPTIDDLNLHPSLHEIAKLKSGLVLTCGPTDVGKSTTIAAIVNQINLSRPAHIVTLENPIEYRFQSTKSFIQQRELGAHIPSFEQGLLDVLRENPDVIVVGELREPETMRLTLNAAESGHLVIATLHASNPEEAIYRLCNAVPVEAQNEIRFQLASTLSWLIVQQLSYQERVGFRVPLLTIVRGTSSIKNIIRENKLQQLNSAIQMGKGDGMFSSERYLDEYLAGRSDFVSPLKTFSPSSEVSQEIMYHSPLVEEMNEPMLTTPRRSPVVPAQEPLKTPMEPGFDETEHMLTIDGEGSLQDVISRITEK
jgi:twitching motility protein PilT